MRLGAVHGARKPGLVAAFAVAVAACDVADPRPSLPDALPDTAVAYLRPDTLRTVRLGPGLVYRYIWSGRGPWAVHLVQADLEGRCDLELGVLQAEARESGGVGRERVSSMARRSERDVLVAVNADFFTPEGTAVGTEMTAGRVTSVAKRPALAWTLGRPPWIGTAAVVGDSVLVGWPVSASRGDGLTEAVGGFPELLDGGVRVGDLEVTARPSFAAARHPRTAVGYDPRNGWAWIVVVDGRQRPHSDGMTLPELAGLFETLGASEAINLDGGGSTIMVVADSAVSRPSDLTGERPVANGLALVQSARGCGVNESR